MGFLRKRLARRDLLGMITTAALVLRDIPRQRYAFTEAEMGSEAQLQANALWQEWGDQVTRAVRHLRETRKLAIEAGPEYGAVVTLLESLTEKFVNGEDTEALFKKVIQECLYQDTK